MWDKLWHRKRHQPLKKASDHHQSGLDVLSDSPHADADIVFIHGLGGDRTGTWTAANNVMWPRDLLPMALPTARIMSFGYDTRLTTPRHLTREAVYLHADNLLSHLGQLRQSTRSIDRPLIFIAHSLGGIVSKSALLRSTDLYSKIGSDFRSMMSSTRGIVFLAVPHRGDANGSWAKTIRNIVSLESCNLTFLKGIERESFWLGKELELFKSLTSSIEACSCVETKSTSRFSRTAMVVSEESAMLGGTDTTDCERISFEKDHYGICKFASEEDPDYKRLLKSLSRMLKPVQRAEICQRQTRKQHQEKGSESLESDFRIPFQPEYRRNVHFVGRRQMLDDLHTCLTMKHDKQRSQRYTLTGLGGAGKSQIALEYAYRHQDHFDSVFWINARDMRSAQTSYSRFAQRLVHHYADQSMRSFTQIANYLSIDGFVNEHGDIDWGGRQPKIMIDAMKQWLGRDRNCHWLLIVDNVDELTSSDILDILPDSSLGRVILTTRRRDLVWLGHEIHVSGMPKDDSIRLFLKSFGDCHADANPQDNEEIARLVHELDYLPLAIATAGSLISKLGIPLHQYRLAREINEYPQKSFLACEQPSAGINSYTSIMYKTWQLSFKTLDRPTLELLLMCSYFSSDEIPIDILDRGMPKEEYDLESDSEPKNNEKALRSRWDGGCAALNGIRHAKREDTRTTRNLTSMIDTLVSHSMIRRTQRIHQSFVMHHIVQKWARETQDPITQLTMVVKAIRTVANSLRAMKRNWQLEQCILPHIIACVRWAEDILNARTQIIRHDDWSILGHVCKINCKYDEARKLFKLALEDETLIQEPRVNRAKILLQLGAVYEAQSCLSESELLYRSGLELLQLADEPWSLKADLLLSLASVLSKRHMASQATAIFDHVLAHSEDAYGLNHPRTLHLIDVLAEKYGEVNSHENAEILRRRELLYYERHVGPYNLIIKNARMALAQSYQKQGKYEAAAQVIQAVLLTQESRLGPNHPSSLDLVARLAVLCDLQGRFDESEDLHQRALVGKTEALGPDHPGTIGIKENMALRSRLRDDYQGAEELYLEILQRKRRMEYPRDDIQATAMRLADMYEKQGRFEDVKSIFEQLDGVVAAKY